MCLSAVLTDDDGIATHVQCYYLLSSVGKAMPISEEGCLQLHRLPKGIETFFPTLASLQWDNGKLTSVTSEDLKPFPDWQLTGY